MKTKRILLDTHVWLWHISGEETLSHRIINLIDTAASRHELFISAISVWEIAMLANKRKIVLNSSCLSWINASLSLPGITLILLSPEIAVESCQLPDNFHGDPADRILAATAKIENLTLITRDKKLLAYGAKKHINTLSA
jgi:PIN domain nuclease of toxin-antitoxin system